MFKKFKEWRKHRQYLKDTAWRDIGSLLTKHDFENFYKSRAIRSMTAVEGTERYTCTVTVKLRTLWLFINPLAIFRLLKELKRRKPFIFTVTVVIKGPILTATLRVS